MFLNLYINIVSFFLSTDTEIPIPNDRNTESTEIPKPNDPFSSTEYRYRRYQKSTESQLCRKVMAVDGIVHVLAQ